MNITADTDVLVRSVVLDDPGQARSARGVLERAAIIVLPLSCLCETVWVLRVVYKFTPELIAFALEQLLAAGNVRVDRPAVEAGLGLLRAGGDFADGAIAQEGRQLGGNTFVSFDKRSVRLLGAQGFDARLL